MKAFSFATCTFLTWVGLSALYTGMALIVNSDGSGLWTVDALNHSPFYDFLLPGIIMLIIISFFSLFGAFLAYKNSKLAGIATFVLGIITLLWIVVQTYWSGWGIWHQPVFVVIGLVELSLGYHLLDLQHEYDSIAEGQKNSHSF